MYWCVSNRGRPSSVEALLDKDNFTLEELLEEEDVISEVKAFNARLITVLQRPDSMSRLVHYITVLAPDSASEQRRSRYPFAACEILCCEIDPLMDSLIGCTGIMDELFAPLREAHAPECRLAGYCARIVAALVVRRGVQLLAWLQGHQDLMGCMVDHLGTTSVAETLVRLIAADEATAAFLPYSKLMWLPSAGIIEGLLSKLRNCPETDTSENAAEVLAAIARARSCPLTGVLASPQNLHVLVTTALSAGQGPSLVQALNVYIALLDRRQVADHAGGLPGAGSASPASRAAAVMLEDQAIAGLAPHAARLAELLSLGESTQTQEAPWGLLSPPLGTARLTVIALVAVLLRTGTPSAESALMSSGALTRCLHLVRAFPLNSILHHQVAMMLLNTLESNSDDLIRHLCYDCSLLDWIIDAPSSFTPQSCPGMSSGPGRPRTLRTGYRGHLVQLANHLLVTAKDRPCLAEAFACHQRWWHFVQTELQQANEVGNIARWRCGRPPSSQFSGTLSAVPLTTSNSAELAEGESADHDLQDSRTPHSDAMPDGTATLEPVGEGGLSSDSDESSDGGGESSDEAGGPVGLDGQDRAAGDAGSNGSVVASNCWDNGWPEGAGCKPGPPPVIECPAGMVDVSLDDQAPSTATSPPPSCITSAPARPGTSASSPSPASPSYPSAFSAAAAVPQETSTPADSKAAAAKSESAKSATGKPELLALERKSSDEPGETAPTDAQWIYELFSNIEPVRPRRMIASASCDLQVAHSWPKMGLPRVRSREDARARTLMRKEQEEKEEEKQERRRQRRRHQKQKKSARPALPYVPAQALKPDPQANAATIADVLEGFGAVPQTPDKVVKGEAGVGQVVLASKPGLRPVNIRAKDQGNLDEQEVPAWRKLPAVEKPSDLSAAAKRGIASGPDVHMALHSSLNVISSAPRVHVDIPVDGNAETVIAVSPFASLKSMPFGRAADGAEAYRSDESDEGECVSSRSASLHSQDSAGRQQASGASAKAAVWDGAAWVVPDSSSDKDAGSSGSLSEDGDDEGPGGSRPLRRSRQLGSTTTLGDASSDEEEGGSGDDDDDDNEGFAGFRTASGAAAHARPLATDEELLGTLPDWKAGSARSLRAMRHVISAPMLTSIQEERLGLSIESIPEEAPAAPEGARAHPLPIKQALQASGEDRSDSPVSHWLSPKEGAAEGTDSPSHSEHQQQHGAGLSGLGRAFLYREESDEEDTLLGRFTKLDLSPSEISAVDPGSLGGTLMDAGPPYLQDFGSFQYWRPTYWQREVDADGR